MRMRKIGLAMLFAGCSTPATPTPAGHEQASPSASSSEPAEAPAQPPPLSAEDLALIEADPTTLTPEQRRERAHALRRKIMQDPDSPAARTLEDLRRAHEDGLLELPRGKDGGVVLSTPGAPAASGAAPAGSRPGADSGSEATP
jgi:hypothetical protein